jgi:hypothetical protein
MGSCQEAGGVTAINCFVSPHLIAVATDTLVTDMRTWRATFHVTKVETMPHIGCLLTCKGIARLIPDVCSGLFLSGVRGLDDAVPVASAVCKQTDAAITPLLPQLAPAQRALLDDGAFFLFGWSEKQGRLAGYRFPVRDGFDAYQLGDGCHAHPVLDVRPYAVGADNLAGLVEMVRAQEGSSRHQPESERDHIGGHVIVWTMRNSATGPEFSAKRAVCFAPTAAEPACQPAVRF